MTIFTFSQWFLLGIILLGGLLIIGIIIYNGEKIKYTIYAIAATILALGIAGGAMYWLNTRTASGARRH